MDIELRPLKEQTLVITGASSGIGLATAKMAAKRGARLVLASRSKSDLKNAVKEVKKAGGEATYVVADVADLDEVHAIAERAVREFGGVDTWVNNAGVSIYGRLEQTPPEDARRLFETNYWGVVNGSMVAVQQLRRRGGGALINVGSVLSDRAIPLQGHYSASKHAVKGFTDALRMELEEEDLPISVTLVKPSSIDTPYTRHARNLMRAEPSVPAPVYAPKTVARAILACAERPRRQITVGGGGRVLAALGNVAPRLTDRYMERTMFDQQKSDRPADRKRRDALYRPQRGDMAERGDYPGHVMKSSAYTQSVLHPGKVALGAAALGIGLAWAFGSDPFGGDEFPRRENGESTDSGSR